MQKLIIFAALVACCLAAPLENIKETFQTADLARPSPINPDILSDPKPEEKVTLIADAEEQSLPQTKVVPNAVKLPGPYVPPTDSLSRLKREDKDSSDSKEDSSEEDKKPSPPLATRPLVGPSASLFEKIAAKTSTTAAPVSSSTDLSNSDGPTSDASTSSTTSAPTPPRRPYSPLIHSHNEHHFKPSTDAATSASSTTTAAPSVVASNDHINDKRDIPVPLTRKYHHDDEETNQKEEPDTADAPKEEVKQEETKDEDRNVDTASHPVAISRPIPVAELFGKKPSTV